MFYQAIKHMLKGINQQMVGRALKKKTVEPVCNQVLILCFDLNSNSSKATWAQAAVGGRRVRKKRSVEAAASHPLSAKLEVNSF